MPRRVLMDDFPQYLPFVNRERQVADCVSHFAKAFTAAYDTESGQRWDDEPQGTRMATMATTMTTTRTCTELPTPRRKSGAEELQDGDRSRWTWYRSAVVSHARFLSRRSASKLSRDMLVAHCSVPPSLLCCTRQVNMGPLHLRCCWERGGTPRLRFIGRVKTSTAACRTRTDIRPCTASCTSTSKTGRGTGRRALHRCSSAP